MKISLTEKLKSLLTNFSEKTLEDSKRLYEIGVVTRVNEKAEDMSPPSLSNSFRQKRSLPNRIHEFDIRPVYSECESYYWDEDVDENEDKHVLPTNDLDTDVDDDDITKYYLKV